MRRVAGVVAMVFTLGCGGSSTDRTTAACQRIWDTSCAKFVACKVYLPGTTTQITAAVCTQLRANGVMTCVMDDGAGIAAATDMQVDACVQGFADFACTNLCNQVPQDPPACNVIDSSTNTSTYTCAP